MEFPEVLTDLSTEQLSELRAATVTAFQALVAVETPTEAQIVEAEGLRTNIETVDAEFARRAELTSRAAALREFTTDAPEVPAVEVPVETPPVEAPAAPAAPVEAAVETPPAAPAAPPVSPVQALAARTGRPAAPQTERRNRLTMRAAVDVPNVAANSELNGVAELADALVARMSGFSTPTGDGSREDLRHFGVASIRRDFPEDMTIDRNTSENEVLEILRRATDEHRLEGGSLTASGGWCAPSEQLYDLCETETTEGILSLPTVQVARGGFKYTMGPDFATILGDVGFAQTEAQAIAGTTKACFEVPCPSFVEKRLDAVGLCIKAPILTNAAYPELVQRWLRGALVAHQRKVNVRHINALTTALGTAIVATDVGSTAASTLNAIELVADQQRAVRAWSFNQSLEVVLPHWVRGAVRADLALRSGKQEAAITDAMIQAEFAARHVNVQWVYDLNPLTAGDVGYNPTFTALMYPAGSFVVGTSDVIKLNAVYDAASLAANVYTALFFEEGDLTAQMCPGGAAVTIPVCSSGRTGAANITGCYLHA